MQINSHNQDPQEIAKFTAMAAQWWDPNGDLKTLHQINPLRLGYILEKTPLQGKTVIDIGCGGGILAESMAKQGAIVTGIDLNSAVIEVAQLHQLESHTEVEYLTTSAETLAKQRPQQYDIVTCFEMLEHVPDPASIVQTSATLVKPGGHLFFSTLNRNMKSYLFAIVGAEYLLKLLPKNTHDYAKFIRPSELAKWLENASLQPQETRGVKYDIFDKSFAFCQDVSVNYFMYAITP